MIDALEHAFFAAIWPLKRLFNPADPLSLFSLAGSACVAAMFVLGTRRLTSGGRSRTVWDALFPPGVLMHPSTRLDLRVFFINGLFFSTFLAFWIFGSDIWAGWTSAMLAQVLGPTAQIAIAPWVAQLLATLIGVLALDFGYYGAHWLAHRLPVLWRFHRQHHAAEVMTPLTGIREHPVDMLLFGNFIGFSVGVSTGALAYVLGSEAAPFQLFHTNVLLFAFYVTLQHLRHSHVWLPLSGVAGHIVQSPAHHQLHHSVDPAHQGKNLGFALSLFDHLFGTLLVPRREGSARFGLTRDQTDHSLRDFYFQPFQMFTRSTRRPEDEALTPAAPAPLVVPEAAQIVEPPSSEPRTAARRS